MVFFNSTREFGDAEGMVLDENGKNKPSES